jgi:sugar phosphate isomerase/epimerase
VSRLRFGVSTHLYHGRRLDREHLAEIAAHGFDSVEVFATRTHFAYQDRAVAEALARWLDETHLTLHSMHAPICASLVNGVWGEAYSNADLEEARRRRALAEAEAALAVARTVPYRYLVVHLGVPDVQRPQASDNDRDAARRSIEELRAMASRVGVRVALEVIPNRLSSADALVAFIENDLERADVGICLDVGHAHLIGEVSDAIEACSGHVVTTHLHDNRRQSDDHLAPGEGSIDWPAALMALQKVGYDGAWIFEVADTSTPAAVLEKTVQARRRFEALVSVAFDNPASL